MNFFKTILILTITLLSLNVYAARPAVALVDQVDIPIVSSEGKTLDKAQILKAIRIGAATRNWTITEAADGGLIATLLIRKHKVVVGIEYDLNQYSIHYKDSILMRYEVKDGQQMIHPFYNKWVENLKTDINVQLINL